MQETLRVLLHVSNRDEYVFYFELQAVHSGNSDTQQSFAQFRLYTSSFYRRGEVEGPHEDIFSPFLMLLMKTCLIDVLLGFNYHLGGIDS